MPSKSKWIEHIMNHHGRIGGTINGNPSTDMIDGCWFENSKDAKNVDQKKIRDTIAREMRKDGWDVKATTNSLGWFFRAIRTKEI